MTKNLSDNTKAILLLTAPLLLKRGGRSADEVLKLSEYNRLARLLREMSRQPSDLLGPDASELISECRAHFDAARLQSLLARGFQLSQVVNAWAQRAIWVVSRADPDYPRRLKSRLREMAPPVLFGCGDASLAETGGLAVVGSRNVDESILEATREIAGTAAAAGVTVVSGGAKGVDRAAMEGALRVGGRVVGIVADSLSRLAVATDTREYIRDGRLLLLSPFDPQAGFHVGNAMQRNKYIYGLAEAGLVMNTDYKKGGTWAGADEQLNRFHSCPIYVRSSENMPKGNRLLLEAGAARWPNDLSPEGLRKLMDAKPEERRRVFEPYQGSLFPDGIVRESKDSETAIVSQKPSQKADRLNSGASLNEATLEDAVFAAITPVLLEALRTPQKATELAKNCGLSGPIIKKWLERLCDEGLIEKTKTPQRYVIKR